MKCLGCCPLWWPRTEFHLDLKSQPTSPAALCPNWSRRPEVRTCDAPSSSSSFQRWFYRVCFQLRPWPGVAFRARRSRGGRGRRVWPSCRTSSWWTASWWCRSPASTTFMPKPTSDTPTPWRMMAGQRRRRSEEDLCCSTSTKRCSGPSSHAAVPPFYLLIFYIFQIVSGVM